VTPDIDPAQEGDVASHRRDPNGLGPDRVRPVLASHFQEDRATVDRELANAPADIRQSIPFAPTGAAIEVDE
jgi:hypothetical protein